MQQPIIGYLAMIRTCCKNYVHMVTAVKLASATHSKGSTMHSSVDVRHMILLPSSRSATTQTPSTGDRGLQQQTSAPTNYQHSTFSRHLYHCHQVHT